MFIKFHQKEGMKGTVLIAQEEVNGNVAGSETGKDEWKNDIQCQDQ